MVVMQRISDIITFDCLGIQTNILSLYFVIVELLDDIKNILLSFTSLVVDLLFSADLIILLNHEFILIKCQAPVLIHVKLIRFIYNAQILNA